MKTQLILLNEPIIVSDEKHTNKKSMCWNGHEVFPFVRKFSTEYADRYWQKVIAGLLGLPSINWNNLEDEFMYFTQYISQPKVFDIEIEMENCDKCIYLDGQELNPNCCHNHTPKITNNQIKILRKL